ncbi:amino acid ABC transporter ATP-binding protein [Rhizobium setariae]|nr:amino acid ABC transporter ATP-binding protein [Rhizobium setariae]
MMTKLSIRNLRKSFGALEVCKGISLDLAKSELICLIGGSGSGKSTLLRCLNLLEHIDDGEILLDGEDISVPGYDPERVRRRIGMVFQSYNLFPHMSVLKNLTLAQTRIRKTPPAEAKDLAMELLLRFGLADKAETYPDKLSGGQQQRVAIARALAMEPEILLLDEITSALDPELVGEVLRVVRDLKAQGITMLLATHEMGFARSVADRVAFLSGGSLLEVAPPEKIFTQPDHEQTRQFLKRVLDPI